MRLSRKITKYPSLIDEEKARLKQAEIESQLSVFHEQAANVLSVFSSVDGRVPDFSSWCTGDISLWKLPLPSQLPKKDMLCVQVLLNVEVELRDGAAYEAARLALAAGDQLQKFALDKIKHGSDVAEKIAKVVSGANVKSTFAARELEWNRNCAIADFNAHLKVIEDTGMLEKSKLKGLPRMEKEDTYRKRSSNVPRQPGDSRRHEGFSRSNFRAFAGQSTQAMGSGGGRQGVLKNLERGEKRLPEKRKREIDDGEPHTLVPPIICLLTEV